MRAADRERKMPPSSHISDSYVTGSVSGSSPVGGLVGENTGPITDSYFNG